MRFSVLAMMGIQEKDVSLVRNWARFTRSSFGHQVFQGGHFFIHQHPWKIAEGIWQHYMTSKKLVEVK